MLKPQNCLEEPADLSLLDGSTLVNFFKKYNGDRTIDLLILESKASGQVILSDILGELFIRGGHPRRDHVSSRAMFRVPRHGTH